MSDYYTEQLVKRKMTAKAMAAKVGLILLAIISFFLIFVNAFAILVPVLLVVGVVFLFKRTDVEYEYLYVNGELDIDKIMSKEKRKRIFSMAINDLEIIAPKGAHELAQYRQVKIIDYSSQIEGHKFYEMVINQSGQKTKIVFEPNETILDGMRMLAPRKVII